MNRLFVEVLFTSTFALAAPALFGQVQVGQVQDDVAITSVESTDETAGQSITAICVRLPHQTHREEPVSYLVLVDTSASQTGSHQRRALEACAAIIQGGQPDDRIALAAIDVTCTPLSAGFHPSNTAALGDAYAQLEKRIPLGATDFLPSLSTAAELFPSTATNRAIIYIGDGPNINAIDPHELSAFVDELRRSRVSFSSIGIGQQVNWTLLAAVANATGGMLLMPDQEEPARLAGEKALEFAHRPIAWVQDARIQGKDDAATTAILPKRFPPVRADRDSVILVKGLSEGSLLQLSFEDPDGERLRDVALPVPAVTPAESNAYLAELFRNSAPTQGLFLPTLGKEGLLLSRVTIEREASALTSLSWQARSLGDSAAATRLALAALRRNPANDGAALIHETAQIAPSRDEQGGEALPVPGRAAEIALPPGSGGGDSADADELAELQAFRKVRAQQLERETAVRIRDARALLATSPDDAREALKDALIVVRDAADLDEASRQRLVRQIESRIRESILRSRELSDRNLAAERQAAIGRERLRLTEDLVRREDTIKQLVNRYNALVEIGIRRGFSQGERYPKTLTDDKASDFEQSIPELGEAERVIGDQLLAEAPELWAHHPLPMPARELARTAGLVARTLDYIAENYRTRRDQERGFMDVLHLVDVAAIPLPDEPPIIYPSVARWRTISALRAKYKDATLAPESKSERDIEEALKSPTGVKFRFEQNSLEDLRSAIQDRYRINVIFDGAAMQDFDPAEPVITGDYSAMTLRSALRRILKPLELTYTVTDEVLLITTRTQAETDLVRKVYPVGDLVVPIGSGNSVNPFNLGGVSNQNQNNPMPGGGAGGLGIPCWLAREVYGPHDPRWLIVRDWVMHDAPEIVRSLYIRHGEELANWVRVRPVTKLLTRHMMDTFVVRPRSAGSVATISPATFHLQVSAARTRLTAATEPQSGLPSRDSDSPETTFADGPSKPTGASGPRIGQRELPEAVINAPDLRVALREYLEAEPPLEASDSRGGTRDEDATGRGAGSNDAEVPVAPAGSILDDRLARLRFSARELGRQGDFQRAVALLEAAISIGLVEPWMYDALAVAMEAAGRPTEDIDRVLLSAADFATSATDLLPLAHVLSRRGSDRQALRLCRQIVQLEPLSRPAYVLALASAERLNDETALAWACAGVLSNEWPATHQDLVKRAGRLAKVAVERLRNEGRDDVATAFRARIDEALVRDLVIEISWTGHADFDLTVEEPPGTICSRAEPRTIAGGVLLQNEPQDPSKTSVVQSERYVAAMAFPGDYRVVMRRSFGQPVADVVTVEMTFAKGTSYEERIVRRLSVSETEQLMHVSVPSGRRTLPLDEARLIADVATHQGIGRLILSKRISEIVDEETEASLSDSRRTLGGGLDADSTSAGSVPFFGRRENSGYQPVITTLPEGLNHRINSVVVSHDRKYVRVNVEPFFSVIGPVVQFNFAGGGAQGGQGGMGGGGMGGQGGMGGGGMGGQGGMGGGGMGGMGGGGMGGGGMGGMGGGGMGGMGGMCWVAREVYGPANPRWLLFRAWLLSADAPAWLRDLYSARGEAFAAWIHDKPAVKAALRVLMDAAIESATLRVTSSCPALE